MPKDVYIGESGLAKKVKQIYIGVDGVAKKVKKGYVGVDGVARLFFQGNGAYYGTVSLINGSIQYYDRDTGSLIASVGSGIPSSYRQATIPGRFFVVVEGKLTIREYDLETGVLIHEGDVPKVTSVDLNLDDAIGGTTDGRLYVGTSTINQYVKRIDPDTYTIIENTPLRKRSGRGYDPLGGNASILWIYYDTDRDYDPYIYKYDTSTWAAVYNARAGDYEGLFVDETDWVVSTSYMGLIDSWKESDKSGGISELDPTTYAQLKLIIAGNFEARKPTIIR